MVVSKIKGGADLMTPGLAGPPFPAGAKLGAVVAIASLENPSVPVAIGICTIDISTLQSARGAKGHAVEILHWAGDEVWDWSTSGKSGLTPPENLEGWIDESADNLAGDAENLKIDDDEVEEGGVALPQADSQASQRNNGNPYVSGEDIVEVVDMDEEKDMTTEGTSFEDNTSRQPQQTKTTLRNRQCIPSGILLRRPPPPRNIPRPTKTRAYLSLIPISRHVRTRPPLPPSLHPKANRITCHKKDELEERAQVHQSLGQAEVTFIERSTGQRSGCFGH